ncbi:DNA polymerase III subunit delta [Klugiella xanthotipulae]|uniref:DNA-directed DNA polymerase n=1 Tax=Klugiella xanthotipulae TaxID=244735 RepID=A0A543HSL5_9MICO|nr:DNA polymerase III subunit delta [Klugiella xanthotipulae]TQM61254.1 DNA polymerase III delta subunit [Klugiella xanthotipulae]
MAVAKANNRGRAKAAAVIPQLSWSEVRPAALVLVSGTQAFLADRAIRLFRDILRAEDPSIEISDISADSYTSGELMTLASPSLFGEPRLIRVSSVEKCSDAFLADAQAYLSQVADDTYVVLRHGGGQRGKALLDAVRRGEGNGIEIICAEITKDTERYAFAQAEFTHASVRVTPGALRSLVTAFADDIGELASACGQLIADASAEVTEETVDRYYGGRVETNAFRVADSAIAGRAGEALVLLRHALGTGAEPIPLLAAFASKLRTMGRIYGVRGGAGQLASAHGMAPWQVDRARRDMDGWTEHGLAVCIQAVADTDAQLKGAGRDPVYALEKMVLLVARKGRAAA